MTDESRSGETKGEPVPKDNELAKEPLSDEELASIAAGRREAMVREQMELAPSELRLGLGGRGKG